MCLVLHVFGGGGRLESLGNTCLGQLLLLELWHQIWHQIWHSQSPPMSSLLGLPVAPPTTTLTPVACRSGKNNNKTLIAIRRLPPQRSSAQPKFLPPPPTTTPPIFAQTSHHSLSQLRPNAFFAFGPAPLSSQTSNQSSSPFSINLSQNARRQGKVFWW